MNRLRNLLKKGNFRHPALAAAAVLLLAGLLATSSFGTTRKDGGYYGK